MYKQQYNLDFHHRRINKSVLVRLSCLPADVAACLFI